MINNNFNRSEIVDERGNILVGRFSDFLIREFNIITINEQIHMYKDGIYVSGEKVVEQAMLTFFPEINMSKRRETIAQILLKAKEYEGTGDFAHLIAFKNGIYNIVERKLVPFSKDYIITNRIPHIYNPDAYSEDVDNLLTRVADNDPEIRAQIEEMWGSCLRRSPDNVAFILLGAEGSNGKSTIQSIGIKMLGRNNVSAIDLSDFSNDRFAASGLYGKLANIADDISGEYISDPSMFKSLTTGECVRAQRKFEHSFDFCPYATMIFSANRIPRVKDADGGVRRRMRIIPFTRTFKASDPDFDAGIKNRILYGSEKCSAEDSMSYFINLAIAGMHRAMDYGYTDSAKCADAFDDYDKECNPIIEWCEDFLEEYHSFYLVPREEAYCDYKEWAVKAGQKPLSQRMFGTFLCERYSLEIKPKYVNGKTVRAFVEKG